MERFILTAPTDFTSIIHLPSSKSICNRALLIHALTDGNHLPENLSDCDDTRVMVEALRSLPEVVDIGAAGTAMRFLTAYLSITDGNRIITGTQRMQNRPIAILVDALRALGASIVYKAKEGYPPLQIEGKPLKGASITLSGDVSSQYISALLMIGPMLEEGLELTLTGSIVSRPYIEMTLQLMRTFGAEVTWAEPQCLRVAPKPYVSIPFTVESDWSAASYWYEMVALASRAEVFLPGLSAQRLQGDARVADWFAHLGVETIYEERGVRLRKKWQTVDHIAIDFVEQPDLAQTFVVTACLLEIPFHFTGLQSLRIKETDRIHALCVEMHKLGYILEVLNGAELKWDGQRCEPQLSSGIDTYEDHRMALAFAPAAFRMKNVKINRPQVVTKSYPGYWSDLEKIGFSIKKEN